MIKNSLLSILCAPIVLNVSSYAAAEEYGAWKVGLYEKRLIEKDAVPTKDILALERLGAGKFDNKLDEKYVNPSTPEVVDSGAYVGGGKRAKPVDVFMTVGPVEGDKASRELLAGKVSRSTMVRMMDEAAECKGQQKELGGYSEESIKKCFIGMKQAVAEDLQYVGSLDYISSLADNKFLHKCVVSVVGEGRWITAAHCVPVNYMTLGLSILVDGRFVFLKANSVVRCESPNCDIAIINLKTPVLNSSKFPGAALSLNDDYWGVGIIVAGMPEKENLQALRMSSDYKEKLLWGAVGRSYCRIMNETDEGCLVHGCSTLTGFSGSPIYMRNQKAGRFEIVGIHSGTNLDSVQARGDRKCGAGLEINYATRTKGEGF